MSSNPEEGDGLRKMPRTTRVKNKAPAPIQITAEQILREAQERQDAEPGVRVQSGSVHTGCKPVPGITSRVARVFNPCGRRTTSGHTRRDESRPTTLEHSPAGFKE